MKLHLEKRGLILYNHYFADFISNSQQNVNMIIWFIVDKKIIIKLKQPQAAKTTYNTSIVTQIIETLISYETKIVKSGTFFGERAGNVYESLILGRCLQVDPTPHNFNSNPLFLLPLPSSSPSLNVMHFSILS